MSTRIKLRRDRPLTAREYSSEEAGRIGLETDNDWPSDRGRMASRNGRVTDEIWAPIIDRDEP